MDFKISTLKKLLIIFFIISCSKKEGIEITNAYGRIGIKGGTSAVFMKIRNYGQTDTLYEVHCDCSEISEIHETFKEGERLNMRRIDFIEIKNHFEFKPLSYHIMLINLKKDLNENDTIEIKLKFKKNGEKLIKIPIKRL
jgi:copper(I)-binding protein